MDRSSERTGVPLGSGRLGVGATSAKGNKRGTQTGNKHKGCAIGGASKGMESWTLSSGGESSQYSRQQNLHKGAHLGRAGKRTRQTSQAWLPTPFPRKRSPPPSLSSPPAQRAGGRTAGIAGLLTSVSGAGRAASCRKGVPGLGAEEGVAQGKQEMPGGRNRGVPKSLDRSASAEHRGRLTPNLRTPQSSSGDSLGPAHACRVVL